MADTLDPSATLATRTAPHPAVQYVPAVQATLSRPLPTRASSGGPESGTWPTSCRTRRRATQEQAVAPVPEAGVALMRVRVPRLYPCKGMAKSKPSRLSNPATARCTGSHRTGAPSTLRLATATGRARLDMAALLGSTVVTARLAGTSGRCATQVSTCCLRAHRSRVTRHRYGAGSVPNSDGSMQPHRPQRRGSGGSRRPGRRRDEGASGSQRTPRAGNSPKFRDMKYLAKPSYQYQVRSELQRVCTDPADVCAAPGRGGEPA